MTAVDVVGGWPAVLGLLVAGDPLSAEQAEAAMATVLAGEATSAQIAALIVALRQKGETVDELAGMVGAMQAAAAPLELPDHAIDIVGTGGSPRRRTAALNVSTMACMVAAAAGATVCKHGNIRASSTSGSFDLLAELGVGFDLDGDALAALVAELGIGFCFARAYHPAMRHAAPVRAELGIPTVFNLLGPLSHPGRVRRQVVGVGAPEMLDLVAGVLASRGSEHALVVHGDRSLDELALTGPTEVREVRNGEVVAGYQLSPADVGLGVVSEDQLPGGDPAANAAIARSVLAGEPGPALDIVLLNAAAGLYVGGVVEHIGAGVEAARVAVSRGAASELLARLVERTAV